MNYTIVTAWYDVRTKEENPKALEKDFSQFCSPEHYFTSAKPLFEKPFPMIIFTEPAWEAKIWEARPKILHPLTRVIVRDYEELSYYSHYEKFKKNHSSKPIWNLQPTKFTPLFKFIINQKTQFVKDAVQMNPFSTEMFAWMDLRLHCVYNMSVQETSQVFASLPKDRVLLEQMAYSKIEEVDDREEFYCVTRGKVAAGFFAGYAEPLIKFAKLCAQEFIETTELGFAITDEMLWARIIGLHPNLFVPYFGDYGDCLRNIRYVRSNTHLAINFLLTSFQKGTHYYTHKAAEALRLGYFNKTVSLSAKETHDVWYYNYVACYWLGNHSHCKVILKEFYEILNERKDVAGYLKSVFDFFKYMIGYINDPELVNSFDKFK